MSSSPAQAKPPGVAESGRNMAAATRDWLEGLAQLATLELRYSVRSALSALIAAMVLCATLFAGWALVLVIVSLVLTDAGLSWPWALVVVSIVNVGLAVSLWFVVRRHITQIGLDATQRALGLKKETPAHERSPQPHTAR